MEWDQITEKWAAMALRLRSDRPAAYSRTSGGVHDTRRPATGIVGGAPAGVSSERVVNDNDFASHQ